MCFMPLYVICYWFMYLTNLAAQQWSRIANSDVITGGMRDEDRGVVAAGQPGDRLYKQIVFIAALDCVAAVFCLLHDSKQDIRGRRV
jgi:hypothetical protein